MSEKKGHSSSELLLVALIMVIGFAIIKAVAPREWSLSGALGIPDAVIWFVAALILFGVIGERRR